MFDRKLKEQQSLKEVIETFRQLKHNIMWRYIVKTGKSIDCIKEMDVTSVTSPIGLWTAARKPIVSNLGSAILKISGACWEK